MQIKHVSEIKHSELDKIRQLVEKYHKANDALSSAESKDSLALAIIDLFTIKT